MATLGRLSLTQIAAAVRFNIGEPDTDLSQISNTTTDTVNLLLLVNRMLNQLPKRMAEVMAKVSGAPTKVPALYLDCWRTPLTVLTGGTAGSNVMYLPADYARYVSFWDNTGAKRLHVVSNVDKWHVTTLKQHALTTTPTAVEIMGYTTDGSSNFVPLVRVWPAPTAPVTPSVSVEYWRIPAAMDVANPGSTYPDLDPVFQDVLIYGTTAEMMRRDDPSLGEFQSKEQAMLLDMAYCARAA